MTMKEKLKAIHLDIDPAELRGGVSGKFFLKHIALIVMFVFFALLYITMRYDCVTAMETIAHLQTQLETTRTDTQRERAMFMSATCESSMQQLVDTLHLGLHIQDRPPFKLTIANSK